MPTEPPASRGSADARAGLPLHVVRRGDRDAVLLKPAGQSTEAQNRGECLLAEVRSQFGWPGALAPHRLDRVTRGLVVVARDTAAVEAHNRNIREGRWTKHYIARIPASVGPGCSAGLAVGSGAERLVGRHRAFLRREGRMARVVRSGGDPAFLEILACAAAPGRAGQMHALIRLDTGRYHQIRVMLANLGVPLTGDEPYGGGQGDFYLEHASLWLPDIGSGAMTRFFLPRDPAREDVDPTLMDMLERVQPRME